MTQSGGDEKELVLGNKQLLGVFFVGAALCAVFFAMGYMVGRNSAKNALVTTDAAASSAAPADTAHRQQPEPPRETAADPAVQSAGDQPPPVETKPMRDSPVVPSPQPATEPAKPAAEPKPSHAAETATPEAGAQYLQVAAQMRPDAENTLRSLRERNFPAILAPSPKDGYLRVLVGPYRETGQLAEAKAALKNLGFAGAYVQRQ